MTRIQEEEEKEEEEEVCQVLSPPYGQLAPCLVVLPIAF